MKATSTSTDDVDLLAIDLFATTVQQYENMITMDATKIIAEKFKSNNADEVLLALNVNICRKKFIDIIYGRYLSFAFVSGLLLKCYDICLTDFCLINQ